MALLRRRAPGAVDRGRLRGTPARVHTLGPDLAAGQRPQVVVPAGAWQSAVSTGEWTLVGCTVSPAFEFEGFELAEPGWEPGQPQ